MARATEQTRLVHLNTSGVDSEGSGSAATSVDDSPEGKCKAGKVKIRSVSSTETREAELFSTHFVEDGVILVRPKLRGKIHLFLLILSPVWTALLLSACKSLSSVVAATVSSVSFIANFAASALLHCGEWGPQWRSLVVKLDHAGIFIVISSCTTPIPVLLLDFWPSVLLLSVQGLATLYGFWTIMFGDLSSGARHRRAFTYIAIGLLHAAFLKAYISVLTVKEIVLVLSLAGLYIVGALVYGSRWPDPCPTHFGFHELFHLFCGCSFLLTLWLNYEVITRAESGEGAIGDVQPAAAV
ncbi:hypothetical protein Efla_001511 [Eimeria flavescens]